jgi:hypothetical protein
MKRLAEKPGSLSFRRSDEGHSPRHVAMILPNSIGDGNPSNPDLRGDPRTMFRLWGLFDDSPARDR